MEASSPDQRMSALAALQRVSCLSDGYRQCRALIVDRLFSLRYFELNMLGLQLCSELLDVVPWPT